MIGVLSIGAALRRAPVPAAAAVVLGGAMLHAAQYDFDLERDPVLATAAAAFFGAAAGQGLARTAGAAGMLVVSALLVLFAGPLMVTAWLLVAALALAMLVAPAATGRRTAVESWRALVRTTAAAGLGLLGALVVIAGIVMLTLSADALLGLDWSDVAWTVVLPLAVGWLAPAIFLSLSAGERDERVAEALGLVAQTVARLVLTPLLAVYTVVLALYIARIAVAGSLPSGEIGWIVPLFGVTGAVTVLALSALPESGPSRVFLRAWFPVTVLPVALYALAVAIRVDAYGVTPERYVAILVGAWLAMLAVAFTVAPRGDVRLIPLTLVLTLALGAVGPWSLEPVVTKSLGDRIAAALPAGDPAAALRQTPPVERRPVCSPVATLAAMRELDRVERRLGVTGLEALCAMPWDEGEVEFVVLGDSGPYRLELEGRASVSGPHRFAGERALADSGVALALEGATLTVRAGALEETFDLLSAARSWQVAGGGAPYVVTGEAVTIAIGMLRLAVSPGVRRTDQLTVFVIVPRP